MPTLMGRGILPRSVTREEEKGMDVVDAVASLLEAYESVPTEVRTEALNGGWYRESRRTARALARKHGVSLATAAGVIAALSPRQSWKLNVRYADDMLGGGEGGGYPANREKARRIIEGERPLDVLGGPKVRAFYKAIMGDEEAAVVDVHMFRAMGYDPLRPPPYEEAEMVLREAASLAGVPTATFQAIVWAEVRGGGE